MLFREAAGCNLGKSRVTLFWLVAALSLLCFLGRANSSWLGILARPLSRLRDPVIVLFVFVILLAGIRQNLWLVVVVGSLLAAISTAVTINRHSSGARSLFVGETSRGLSAGRPAPGPHLHFQLNRSWNYGLAFYFRRELPEWSTENPDAALVLTNEKGLDEIIKAGRFQGELNEAQQGILYVPISPLPR